jgi:hypothetical protein
MDIYRYVNKTNHAITVGNITIPVAGDYISYNATVPALDRMDGILVDKYLNGKEREDPSTFNYYHPTVSNTKGDGLLLNHDDPKSGWHDLLSAITIDLGAATGKPTFTTLIGGIKKYRFKVGDESFHNFHLPHDYLPGSDLYIHVHWTNSDPAVTSGATTWAFEVTYAKGYNQMQFVAPVIATVTQNVALPALTHQIAEVQLSTPGGSASKLDSNLIETDGLILVRTSLTVNTMTADPFMMFCDLHYQSTGIPTKNRNADFWT